METEERRGDWARLVPPFPGTPRQENIAGVILIIMVLCIFIIPIFYTIRGERVFKANIQKVIAAKTIVEAPVTTKEFDYVRDNPLRFKPQEVKYVLGNAKVRDEYWENPH